jgi:hypothetical protein
MRFKGAGPKKELGKEDFWKVLCRGVRKEFPDSTFKTYERR